MLRERGRLLQELATLALLLHGSWVERFTTCSREECKCRQGQRHGPRHYLVVNEGGRQRQKYIPNSQVESARAGLAQYKRLREIVARLTDLNLRIMKETERESE